MQLSKPEGLWLLSLVLPLVLLYLLKSPRKTQHIGSTWLWQESQRDLLAKARWKRLNAQVPLLLETLVILMSALAATRPVSRGADPLVKHLAIVLDISASMQTKNDEGATRIDLAKDAIAERIGELAPGTDVLLVSAGKTARVVSPLERDRRKLLEYVRNIESVDSEGSLLHAVSLSTSRLRQLSGEKKLLIVTDGAPGDTHPIATGGLETELLRIGSPQENVGIVRVVAKNENDHGRASWPVHVFVSVKNYGRSVQNVYATLHQRNVREPLAARQLQLQPGEQAPLVLSFDAVKSDEGTGLFVELSPGDSLAVDDMAYVTVPLMSRQPVILSPKDETPWLKRALLADPDIDLRGADPVELAGASIPLGALIVYAGYCPREAPPSSYLVVNPPPGTCLLDEVASAAQTAQVTDWKDTDPRLRFLSLGGLQLHAARQIRTDSPDRVLVNSQFGPIMTKQALFGREGTLVSFSFGNSDWPRKASFVLFVRNIVELARTARHGSEIGGHTTGIPYQLSVPRDVKEVRVELPDSTVSKLTPRAGTALLPRVDRAGFYYFSWMGQTPGSALLAANLTAEKESDISVSRLPQVFIKPHTTNPAKSQVVDWTWILCGLGLIFLLVDVWLLTRRPRTRRSGSVKRTATVSAWGV